MKMERFTLKPLLMDTDLNKVTKWGLFKQAPNHRLEVVIFNHQRKGDTKNDKRNGNAQLHDFWI